ncbi:hypothetical protein JQN63_11465 [Delftia lacustris]|uniref:hypothetical protein n=1 Tax=Delftia lacustris TaxID=558537 RepID=UPI00193BF69C|nr:hypothetical protein [Delftia lacustris]QRI92529.1 hypothetical protein JQN63_11465 [Delftia lacustris]
MQLPQRPGPWHWPAGPAQPRRNPLPGQQLRTGACSRIQAHFLGRTLRANGSINARGIQLRGGRDALLAQPGLVDDRLLLSGQLPHEFIAHRRQARRHFSIGLVLADLLEQIRVERLMQ